MTGCLPGLTFHFENKVAVKARQVAVNAAVELQKMDGFGASFLEAGLICINSLPLDKQEEVLRALFDREREARGFPQ